MWHMKGSDLSAFNSSPSLDFRQSFIPLNSTPPSTGTDPTCNEMKWNIGTIFTQCGFTPDTLGHLENKTSLQGRIQKQRRHVTKVKTKITTIKKQNKNNKKTSEASLQIHRVMGLVQAKNRKKVLGKRKLYIPILKLLHTAFKHQIQWVTIQVDEQRLLPNVESLHQCSKTKHMQWLHTDILCKTPHFLNSLFHLHL